MLKNHFWVYFVNKLHVLKYISELFVEGPITRGGATFLIGFVLLSLLKLSLLKIIVFHLKGRILQFFTKKILQKYKTGLFFDFKWKYAWSFMNLWLFNRETKFVVIVLMLMFLII
jgi:hypothetical protein